MTIKILHILWDANIGGIQKLVLELAKHQNARPQTEVAVVFLKTKGPLLNAFMSSGVTIHSLHMLNGYDVRPRTLFKLRSIVRAYDVIHMHSFNPWAAWIIRNTKKQIVYTEHGNFGFGRKLRQSERLNQYLQGRFLRRYPQLITYNSAFSKHTAEKRYHTQDRPCRLIYNGVNLDAVEEQSQMPLDLKRENTFIIGTTSRLAGGKRISTLITIFSQIMKIKNGVELWILGDGPDKEQLEALTVELGISNSVRFLGSHNDPGKYQGRMDICVYPFYNEAFGLVAIESFYLGKPALVLKDGGGLTEIVEKICSEDVCDNEDELVKRILSYSNNPEALKAKGDVFREYAKQYSIEIMEGSFFKAYSQLK